MRPLLWAALATCVAAVATPLAWAGTCHESTAEPTVEGRAAGELADVTWLQDTGDLDGPTLVVFFEAWCPHCRREMPRLGELDRTWSDRGLDVVGLTEVSRGSTEEQVHELLEGSEARFPVGRLGTKTLKERFEVTGVPAAALVKDGVIAWRGHPARLTDELLASVL